MPYLPDVLARQAVFQNGPALAAFLAAELLPRLRSELPVAKESGRTGIDGVSLGGRAALILGFTLPREFGSVGATQPAIDDSELPRWVELAREARRANPSQGLRLLTSHEDYYRRVVTDFAAALDGASLRHRFDLVSGDHSYAFNRGPGAIEMLSHHARELWR
jgi:enterochelin esterase-like enzyme